MLNLLITFLIAAVILYVFYLVLGLIPLPAPIKNIVYIIIGLMAIIWLLNFTGIYHVQGFLAR